MISQIKFYLYKKDSNGTIRIWIGEPDDEGYHITTGILGGKSIDHYSRVNEKNIGKSNQTTKNQQAIYELMSHFKKKQREGYKVTIAEAMKDVHLSPMLAQKYNAHRYDWNNYTVMSTKLDGARCIASKSGDELSLISRKGVKFETLNHIKKELYLMLEDVDNCILDGEIYVHDGSSFQTIMSWIKKYRKEKTERLEYHIFDVIRCDGMKDNALVNVRDKKLNQLMKTDKDIEKLIYVYQIPVKNNIEVQYIFGNFLELGYEGGILKYGTYQSNVRSNHLLKVKNFIDEEFKVVDVIPAEHRHNHGVCVLQMNNGKTFRANLKGTHAERERLLRFKNNYIGKMATVCYFELTDGGIPKFPVIKGFRLEEYDLDIGK